jgi:hypothetical protein
MRNIQGALPFIHKVAPKSMTKAETDPRKGQIDGGKIW